MSIDSLSPWLLVGSETITNPDTEGARIAKVRKRTTTSRAIHGHIFFIGQVVAEGVDIIAFEAISTPETIRMSFLTEAREKTLSETNPR